VGTVAGGQGLTEKEGLGVKVSPGRYRHLEQRLEAELQAASTSKEEALMELKARALQLEEELIQVKLPETEVLAPCPSLGVGNQGCQGLGLSSGLMDDCSSPTLVGLLPLFLK
jgi:hypothetical protein